MNPPSAVLGGGVHGKVCWLIAYITCKLIKHNYVQTFLDTPGEARVPLKPSTWLADLEDHAIRN